MKKKVKGKTLLVTGGASGIGAAIVSLAAERGHRILIADINLAGARAVAKAVGGPVTATRLDITSVPEWERVLEEAWTLGGLDVLINNAAIVFPGNAGSVSIDNHAATLDTNFLGPLRGMLVALPRFKAQGHGHFLTVCSMTAFLPFPGLASYAAAKHALRAFHHALALEERDSGLDFSIVHPTATETPMLDQEARHDDLALAFAGPSVSAESAAETVLRALDRKSVEVFMPPSRGRTVRRVGTDPKALRKLVTQGEEVGLKNLRARRATSAKTE